MRILTAQEVSAAITMREAIDAMREAFIALSTGHALVPLRSAISTPDGTTLFMPAYLEGATSSAIKVVSIYGKNDRFGLPIIMASVLVIDAETGQPRALMAGTYLTALRTGAASGLATELLARPDAAILAVIGAGVQARTQIEAVRAVRPIREIRIYSRHGADHLVAEMAAREPHIDVYATPSASEALHNADVLVAATTSSTPVIFADNVKAGAHINGIGSYTPTMQEIAADVVTQARIVVDSREACLAEAGDLLIPIKDGLLSIEAINTEIGEIAAGLKSGRTSAEQITFFKSVGVAVQDTAIAAKILAAAAEKNLGTIVNF